jgi:hypothetical protein
MTSCTDELEINNARAQRALFFVLRKELRRLFSKHPERRIRMLSPFPESDWP